MSTQNRLACHGIEPVLPHVESQLIKPKIWKISEGKKKKNRSFHGDHALNGSMLYVVGPLYRRLDSCLHAIGRQWRTLCLYQAYLPPPPPLPYKYLPTSIIFHCTCNFALEKLSLFNDSEWLSCPFLFPRFTFC